MLRMACVACVARVLMSKYTYALLNTHAYMSTYLHCIEYLAKD
jgi:hypothetical protein